MPLGHHTPTSEELKEQSSSGKRQEPERPELPLAGLHDPDYVEDIAAAVQCEEYQLVQKGGLWFVKSPQGKCTHLNAGHEQDARQIERSAAAQEEPLAS